MKCPYCGAEIEDGAKFCTSCGKSLQAESDGLEYLGDEPPKKSMEKAIRILVIAAAVIALSGAGAEYLGFRVRLGGRRTDEKERVFCFALPLLGVPVAGGWKEAPQRGLELRCGYG